MGDVISEESFKRRLLQKSLQREYDELYIRYMTREPEPLSTFAFQRIMEEHRVKIIEFFCQTDYVENNCVNSDMFIDFLEFNEWEYEFVKNDLLRITITSSFWFDIYFSNPLNDVILEYYENLLECDVINNVACLDDFILSGDILRRRMLDLQDEYYEKFGMELLPTALQ